MQLEPFLAVFGDLTIAEAAAWIAAVVAIVVLYRRIKGYIIKQHDAEKERAEKMDKVIEQVEMYPKWRQQSINIQKEFRTAITNLENKMDAVEKQNRKRRRNELKERLIQSYHLYASPERNPKLAWSEMESEAFWDSFKDYEELGGDGYIHTVVQPAMEALEVIKMSDANRIAEVMNVRR